MGALTLRIYVSGEGRGYVVIHECPQPSSGLAKQEGGDACLTVNDMNGPQGHNAEKRDSE